VNIIIAPHPDDEIIGCWSVLRKALVDKVLYIISNDLTDIRRKEANFTAKYFGFEHQFIELTDIEKHLSRKDLKYVFVPHFNEQHPLHRAVTSLVYYLRLNYNFIPVYYTTEMNIPGLVRLVDWKEKLFDLNKCYPSQKSLWTFDWKYFLFEGYAMYDILEVIE